MKKGKIFKTLAIAGTCLCAPLILSGCDKEVESKVSFRVEDGYIQVTEDGTNWKNLIDVDDLKGEPGQNGVGIDGKQVQFQVTATHIQWRYVGESDSSWKDLIELEDLKGAPGDDGDDATIIKYTVTFDYAGLEYLFNDNYTSLQVNSNSWIKQMPNIKEAYKSEFIGWFIKDSFKQIKQYDFIGDDVTLKPIFSTENAGLFDTDGKKIKTWEEIKSESPESFSTGSVLSPSAGFKELSGSLVIPYNITAIGKYAFEDCKNLTSITMPDSITGIRDWCFSGCSNLTSVRFSNNLSTIGYSAFEGCSKLTNVVIPESVTYIGNMAFYDCDSLVSIEIPKNVVAIGYYAFEKCDSLTSISVHQDNTTYDSRDNCNAIIRTETNTLEIGCQNSIIPQDIIKIERYAFQYCKNLTNVVIPSSVQSIGDDAFNNCDGLINVIMYAGVQKMGYGVFNGCDNLNKIYYYGTQNEFSQIEIGEFNEEFLESTIYYYIENEQDVPDDEGNYWHFDTDGKTPVAW